MVLDEAPDIEPDVRVIVQCANFARVLLASGEQRLRDCQAMSEPSVARHRPLDRDLPANLNDRVTRNWDGRTGRLRAERVSAPLDSKKVLGFFFSISIVLLIRHPMSTGRQAVACPKAAHKSGTYRSLRYLELAALVPSAGTITL
jgi:hypothetical protein